MGVGWSRGRAGARRAELWMASLTASCLAEDRAAAARHAGEHHPAAGRGGGFPLVPQGAGPRGAGNRGRCASSPREGPGAAGGEACAGTNITSLRLKTDEFSSTQCKQAATGATNVVLQAYKHIYVSTCMTLYLGLQ